MLGDSANLLGLNLPFFPNLSTLMGAILKNTFMGPSVANMHSSSTLNPKPISKLLVGA